MKVSDLAYIHDPLSRFVQAHKFLRSLQESENIAVAIRNESLLHLRKEGYSHRDIGELIGVSKQMIFSIEKKAKARGDIDEGILEDVS